MIERLVMTPDLVLPSTFDTRAPHVNMYPRTCPWSKSTNPHRNMVSGPPDGELLCSFFLQGWDYTNASRGYVKRKKGTKGKSDGLTGVLGEHLRLSDVRRRRRDIQSSFQHIACLTSWYQHTCLWSISTSRQAYI